MQNLARKAKQAAIALAAIDIDKRNEALEAIAQTLDKQKALIFSANEVDLAAAKQENLATPLIKRLTFDESKLSDVIQGLHSLIKLPDPLGHISLARELADGLDLYRVSCPIGVVGIIFESRPDALVQITSLCLKSGNAVLLKGGREAINTNRALHKAIIDALQSLALPTDAVGLMETREDVSAMLKLDEYIDLIIPRGSNAFVQYIMDNSRIPVLGHADGICHVFVDESANIDMAIDIAIDSKTQSVAVCNAIETLLVHQNIAAAFLPSLSQAMAQKGVRMIGCKRTQTYIDCEPATDTTWQTEYLDYALSIRIVNDLDEAIAHINQYGSRHTDAIISENMDNVRRFMTLVDSAGVYHNCSTRFADGFRYGFGAEVGVATGKIHARGPMGLEGLCSYKYRLFGSGQTVTQVSNGTIHFTHKDK